MIEISLNGARANASSQACLSCKKRRVKCDTLKPTCVRCKNDKVECPGYVRIKQWKFKQYTPPPTSIPPSKAQAVDAEVMDSDSLNNDSPESDSDAIMPYIQSWLANDQQSLLLHDCIRFINEQQIPSRTPTQAPFKRESFRIEYDPEWPELMQQLLVMNIRQLVVTNNGNDPLSDAQVCHYRAQSLSELKAHVGSGNAVAEPYGLILSCILMLMLGEMQNVQTGSWRYHMDAARKIITFRGGFPNCYQTLPFVRPALLQYISIDMHAATTCSSIYLAKTRKATASQVDYIEFVTDEAGMAEHGYFFPSLQKDMIYITLLRLSRRVGTKKFAPPHDFEIILDSLEDFDALAWADRTSVLGRTLPLHPAEYPSADEIAAWFAVGNAYKAAMLLYLLLSCSDNDSRWQCVLNVKHSLDRCIQCLLDIASSDPDAPAEAQFWKFLGWPMVISTYVRIGWHVGEVSVQAEISRLMKLAEKTGRDTLLTSSGWINTVLDRRYEEPAKRWEWDDGLDSTFPSLDSNIVSCMSYQR